MTGDALIYRRAESSFFRWARVVGIGIAVLQVGLAVLNHREWPIAFWALFTSILVMGAFLRPHTEVSARGIRTAVFGRRAGKLLLWSEIEAVLKPSPYDTSARVILLDGNLRPVLFAGPADAAAIAAVGGKEVRPHGDQRPSISSTATSPRPPREPTLEQRESAMKAEGQRLRDELDRLRRDRP